MNAVVFLVSVFAAFVLTACQTMPAENSSTGVVETHAASTAPLFHNLGNHHHAISSDSPAAQQFFDQGMVLMFGFNHAEAIRSFREAARLDPDCAICYWGVALSYGPNINKPMDEAAVPEAWAALRKAQSLAPKASAKEQAYIAALGARYTAEVLEDRSALDRNYAHAMRKLAARDPRDADAATLFAESLMDLMPWDYWKNPEEPKAEAAEAIRILENVLVSNPYHPGANHYYIHAVEASSSPARAEAAADRLNGLVPGAGHLVHMPAHIYMRVGRYHDASMVNEQAAAADESYIAQCRAQGFYPAAYYPHNIHFLWASATMEGRSNVAINAARKLAEAVPPQYLDQFPVLEEFLPTPLFAYARFDRWDEVLATPAPPVERRLWTGMWYYAQGVALVAKGKPVKAQQQLQLLRTLAEQPSMHDMKLFSGSTAGNLLTLASHVLAGELAQSQANYPAAMNEYQAAIRIQDALPYTEPAPWYFPVRQALGDAYLDAGRFAEAAAIYREDLAQNPGNGWSLFGLSRALRASHDEAGAMIAETQFKSAWQRADVQLRTPRRVATLAEAD